MKKRSSRYSVGPEPHRAAAPLDAVCDGIEPQVADLERFAGQRRSHPPQHRGDPGQQLARAERLGHIVVRAGVEAADAVVLGLARGQHDDRHVGGRLVAAQPAAHLDAARALDHPVEDDQVGGLLRRVNQRFVAVARNADTVSLAHEPVFEQLGEREVVFDQQEFRCRHAGIRSHADVTPL
jgi:hypothetical protein